MRIRANGDAAYTEEVVPQIESDPVKVNFLLELPNFKPRVLPPKRYAKEPDLSILKPQQKIAFDMIVSDVIQGDLELFVLTGVAGTGKSFTINTFGEFVLTKFRGKRIAMTAPTNKAVKILRKGAEYYHTDLDYLTVHRLLGLKEKRDGEKITFVRDKSKPCSLESFDILVIDETSMLSPELFEMLMEFVDAGKIKIIFMGDPYQIPPVGFEEAIPMSEKGRKKYNMGFYHLDEIVRQGAGSPIIETTFLIRNDINGNNPLFQRKTTIGDNGAVVFLGPGENKLMEDMLRLHFTSQYFKEDGDFIKVIAWTNDAVNRMNAKIRSFIYGDDRKLAKLELEEKLVADSPIFDSQKNILFNTNDEMEVVSYNIDADDINNGAYSLKYYDVMVRSLEDNSSQNIHIIHEDSEEQYKEILNLLSTYAKNQQRGTFTFSKAWEEFYAFKDRYAPVKYSYAITAHKSQGSTYHTTVVMEKDIRRNFKLYERNRILYTACSRPSNALIIW